MADRWMDDRDRQWRERDWRRSEDYGRGGYARGGETGRYDEDRSWSGSPEDERGGYGDQDYGGGDLTTGGAYAQDGVGARSRYGGERPRFTPQDYTGRGQAQGWRREDDYEPRSGYGREGRWDERSYRRSASGGRDWDGDRDAGWARFDPDGGRRDYARMDRQDRDDWRDRRDDRGRDGPTDFLSRAGERISSWFRGNDLLDGDDRPRRYREDFGREARPIEPQHRGRGPQGYQRSDERISDEVHDRLTDDPWLDASNISVEVKDREVTLNGSVDNREAKHRAERLVEEISGVVHVQNNLRVNPDVSLTGAGRGFGSSALEAEMRRNEQTGGKGASGLSGRTSTGALAERSAGTKGDDGNGVL